MDYITFPFGKYKGFLIDEIPLTYVSYALQEFSLPIDLKTCLVSSMLDRLGVEPPKIDLNQCAGVRRELAKRYHPDKGGSDLAMQAVNEFHDLLTKNR